MKYWMPWYKTTITICKKWGKSFYANNDRVNVGNLPLGWSMIKLKRWRIKWIKLIHIIILGNKQPTAYLWKIIEIWFDFNFYIWKIYSSDNNSLFCECLMSGSFALKLFMIHSKGGSHLCRINDITKKRNHFIAKV